MIIAKSEIMGCYQLSNDDIVLSFDEVIMEHSTDLTLNYEGLPVASVFKPKMTQVLRELHELGINVVDARDHE